MVNVKVLNDCMTVYILGLSSECISKVIKVCIECKNFTQQIHRSGQGFVWIHCLFIMYSVED